MKKRTIILILPSEASMIKNEEFGLLPRWKRLFDEYKLYFENVEIYTCDKKDFTEKLGIKHHPCKTLIDVKYLKAISYNFWLLSQMKDMKAQIIRFFGSVYPLMPLFQKLNPMPKILSYQYDFYSKTLLDFGKVRGNISYLAERYSVKYIGNIFTTTQELHDILKNRYELDSTVNPNFVDLNVFTPSEIEGDYLFFAGRIFFTKGIDLLIQMIKHFKSNGRIEKLYLAGNGDVDHYKQIVLNEGLSEQISFLGAIPSQEVAKYMSKSKLFVFPTTTQEGHPKSLIEALASGCACIASKVLGNTDVIDNGVNGLLIEPGSLKDLINKTEYLLDNTSARMDLKKAAVLSAKKYEISTVVKNEINVMYRLIDLYEQPEKA